MQKIAFVIILFFMSFTAKSQSVIFEGEIHYVTTYTYFPKALERYKPYMPVTMDVYVRKNLVCKEGPTAFANGYQIHITNLTTNSGYTAMRVSDNTVAYRKTPQKYQAEFDALPTPTSIEYVNETRTIGGFVCKKALVYLPSSTKPFTVYYTNKIPAEAYVVYKGLKGFPLYFETNSNGVTSFSEAKSVRPTKQDDSKFLLPKEYRILPYEEFRQALMKEIN
jgi:GLPGLI family protein